MMKYHFPNITLATKVTLLRLLLIPVFILVMVYYMAGVKMGEPNEAFRTAGLILFLVVAISDAVDGYLARSRNEITRLGTILDPIADKTLLLSAIIVLTRPGLPEFQPQIPMAFTLLVISRDVFLVLGAFVVDHVAGHVDVKPRWSGKVATVFQMAVITWVLAGWGREYFMITVWFAAAFTLLSGIRYLVDGIHQFEQEHGRDQDA